MSRNIWVTYDGLANEWKINAIVINPQSIVQNFELTDKLALKAIELLGYGSYECFEQVPLIQVFDYNYIRYFYHDDNGVKVYVEETRLAPNDFYVLGTLQLSSNSLLENASSLAELKNLQVIQPVQRKIAEGLMKYKAKVYKSLVEENILTDGAYSEQGGNHFNTIVMSKKEKELYDEYIQEVLKYCDTDISRNESLDSKICMYEYALEYQKYHDEECEEEEE